MNELWIPVLDFESRYEISNLGRVRSLGWSYIRPSDGALTSTPAKILKPQIAGKGYFMVGLYRLDGKRKIKYVHRLVAEAFLLGPSMSQVNHKDLDKTNNSASNLEWTDRKGNAQHALANGRYSVQHIGGKTLAVNNPTRAKKLTIEQVLAIREACCRGESQSAIGARFGIEQATVSKIKRRAIWIEKPNLTQAADLQAA